MQPTGPCSVAIVTILQLVPSNDSVLVCYQSHSGRQTTPIATAPPPDHVRVELGWVLLTRVHPAGMVCHGPSCLLRRGSPSLLPARLSSPSLQNPSCCSSVHLFLVSVRMLSAAQGTQGFFFYRLAVLDSFFKCKALINQGFYDSNFEVCYPVVCIWTNKWVCSQ